MTEHEVQNLIAGGESLTVEFKSARDKLPDAEWIETVVCMANNQGGKLIALIHRDYARLGAVHVQLHDDYAIVSNPGGFVTGVTIDNILVAAPHPRNPLLADAFKRIGLVEKTGRGVGIIYTGQLQNGRRQPAYDRSASHHHGGA